MQELSPAAKRAFCKHTLLHTSKANRLRSRESEKSYQLPSVPCSSSYVIYKRIRTHLVTLTGPFCKGLVNFPTTRFLRSARVPTFSLSRAVENLQDFSETKSGCCAFEMLVHMQNIGYLSTNFLHNEQIEDIFNTYFQLNFLKHLQPPTRYFQVLQSPKHK